MINRKRQPGESGETLGARWRRATLGLVFLLSSGPAGLSNVLCIGADGHISLEQASSPCCGPGGPSDSAPGGPSDPAPGGPSDPAPGGPSDPAPGGPSDPAPRAAASLGSLPSQAREDCGDCVDIPLATASTLATARHPAGAANLLQLQLGLELLENLPAAVGVGTPFEGSARVDLAPSSRRGVLSHLRAVVLRC